MDGEVEGEEVGRREILGGNGRREIRGNCDHYAK